MSQLMERAARRGVELAAYKKKKIGFSLVSAWREELHL